MAEFSSSLQDRHIKFIGDQAMFFVATAPGKDGRINLSPKGLDCFSVVNTGQVAYLDLAGSGNETAAHLLENGRITLMFCSFSLKPLILRIYGKGKSVQPRDTDWAQYSACFTLLPGTRQIFVIDIDTVQTSCGFGVPVYDLVKSRNTLPDMWQKQSESYIEEYRLNKNRGSIDGLPTGIKPTLDE